MSNRVQARKKEQEYMTKERSHRPGLIACWTPACHAERVNEVEASRPASNAEKPERDKHVANHEKQRVDEEHGNARRGSVQ